MEKFFHGIWNFVNDIHIVFDITQFECDFVVSKRWQIAF